MTRFSRSGHYRTNHLGTTFWVSDHDVSRDELPDWATSYFMRPFTADDARSASRNITIPNAKCPGCGKPAFFFRDVNGGCAYFYPPLGKPWDKHTCYIPFDAPMIGFTDSTEIARWQRQRRAEVGDDVAEEDLRLAPDQTRGAARIVRRDGTAIAIVDMGEGTRAFSVQDPWPGRGSRMVYCRKAEAPDWPETLEYMKDDLSIGCAIVVGEVSVPTPASVRELSVVAEGCLSEIEAWVALHLPGFRGRRVKIDGRPVGIAGRLGRSRGFVMPLVPWFDVAEDDAGSASPEQIAVAREQVSSWTRRVCRALDRPDRLPANPVCQDVFAWMMPSGYHSHEVEALIEDLFGWKARWSNRVEPAGKGVPGVHIVQSLDDRPEGEIRETRKTFDELASAERAFLARTSKERSERRWLAAAMHDLGLDPIMSAMEREGVRFDFRGTLGRDPTAWGQQAVLPDGTRLLVLLHISDAVDGLAFASFGPDESSGFEEHGAKELFHAKRLRDVLRRASASEISK